MAKKISIDQLSQEIMKELEAFAGQTDETVENVIIKTADDAVQYLRNVHPSGSGQYGSWETYNKSWKKRTDFKKANKSAVVYNEKHYRLTHLLEKGHALRQGGRTRAFPHIEPVARFVNEEFYQNLKKERFMKVQ